MKINEQTCGNFAENPNEALILIAKIRILIINIPSYSLTDSIIVSLDKMQDSLDKLEDLVNDSSRNTTKRT